MNGQPRLWRFRKGRYRTTTPGQQYGEDISVAETKRLQFIKRQLINSGGAICGICGKPITDMKDCTIDHIRPLSKGGMSTIENCQLAHSRCNLLKGNKEEEHGKDIS